MADEMSLEDASYADPDMIDAGLAEVRRAGLTSLSDEVIKFILSIGFGAMVVQRERG